MNIHEDLWKAFNDIHFDDEEGKHLYTDSYGTIYKSATGWAGSFSEPFNNEKVIDEMSARRVEKGGEPISPEEREELKAKWSYAGDYARRLGTEIHSVLENLWYKKDYFMDKRLLVNFPEMKEDFDERKKKCKVLFNKMKRIYAPVENEFIVYDRDLALCGTIDFLAYNMKTGKYEIIDWKTSKSLDTQNFYGKTLKAPFDDLPETNVSEYSLQLSLYKYLLEKHTDIKIDRMLLFQIPNKDRAVGQIVQCYDLSGRIGEYLEKEKDKNLK